MPGFIALGIRPELNNILQGYGIVEATPIQTQTIPILLNGQDVLAQAQTGTGKTLAFLLPILQRINPNQRTLQALIITPTRELALQISTEINKLLTTFKGVHSLPIYGGQDVEKQLKRLDGAIHLVVATPGRLLDHVRRGTIHLQEVKMLVLDEADQMLHMGFLGEVEEIIQETSTARQTMMFSATMPQLIHSLAVSYMRNPELIRVKRSRITVEKIKQIVIETTDRTKQSTLRKLINHYHPFLAIIFCRTKRRAKTLNEALQEHGYLSDELHGDLSQAKREEVMKRFRDGKIHVLVATDVAARGLDVDGVSHVFNYDIPHDVESYIHRIGRTGRAGDKGLAITLVSPKDRTYLEMIEKGIHMELEKESIEAPRVKKSPQESMKSPQHINKRTNHKFIQKGRSKQNKRK